jgi:hypothetical protein
LERETGNAAFACGEVSAQSLLPDRFHAAIQQPILNGLAYVMSPDIR